jgi:methylmalonyl-CoA mutase N-terminal domain/subunit
MPLYDRQSLDELDGQRRAWEADALRKAQARFPERYPEFSTISGQPIDRVYTPSEVADADYARDLGLPGEFPFTRGVHATGHRGRLWTMRMFAGFGTAEETNQRFKYLLQQGQTGLSIAFDMPTLYGYDTDAPEAEGEFGLCGVACSSLADMQVLLDGLPLDAITTSMTINSPAAIIWAMYIAAAEKRGIARARLGGTLQNDILKEYIAQKEFIFPPRPSMRLVTDTVEFAARQMPLWNPISVSGYHIREAGSTAAQELAFTLADGFEYVRWALVRGLEIDEFAPRISFFFNAHNDFFEEIAKYRAARRIWAREMKRNLWRPRPAFLDAALPHADRRREPDRTAATQQCGARGAPGAGRGAGRHAEPAYQLARRGAGAARRGGRHRRPAHTADHRPRERRRQHRRSAGRRLLRGGADRRMERQARAYFQQIDRHGGVLPALEEGFFQREITEAAVRFQREVERGRRVIVGVTDYVSGEQPPTPLLKMDADGYRRQWRGWPKCDARATTAPSASVWPNWRARPAGKTAT